MSEPLDIASKRLLERALPLLRSPHHLETPLDLVNGFDGVRCPVSGQTFPMFGGVVDFLAAAPQPPGRLAFLSGLTAGAWAYDRMRGRLLRALEAPALAGEAGRAQRLLSVRHGDVVLDVGCGAGDLTVELAKYAGSRGLVLAVDQSMPMLLRARAKAMQWGLENILFLCADLSRLPLADGVVGKVYSSWAFHQTLDLGEVLSELGRVSGPRARLAASMLAEGPVDKHRRLKRLVGPLMGFRYVPLIWMGGELQAHGFRGYSWFQRGPWVAMASCRRGA